MRVQRLMAVGLLMGLMACQQGKPLETRTFTLVELEPYEVEPLIAPYVYDREDDPGMFMASEQAVTVRELPENLDRIAEVLARFDKPATNVVLNFQVIEANGFAGADIEIAEVESELRKLFRYEGYRLVADARLVLLEGREAQQIVGREPGGTHYGVHASLHSVSGDGSAVEIEVSLQENPTFGGAGLLNATVSAAVGKTTVLGTTRNLDRAGALILVLTPELDGSPQGGGSL